MTKLFFIIMAVFAALFVSAETFTLPTHSATLAVGAQQTASSDGSWLDRAPQSWNRKMSQLPRPASATGGAEVQERCRDFIRQPDSPAERALVRAGWLLYGSVQYYGLTKVVTAMSGVDGMCRPTGYQAFIYWEGRYAGTLAPAAMNSRADGALTNIRLVSPTRILAEFARYAEADPLCCPTRTTHVAYVVSRDDLPLVAPVNIKTVSVGAPPEEADSEDIPGDREELFGRRWRLTEVDGVAVATTKAYIEFDRAAKRLIGDGGCNRISGDFVLTGKDLRFSRVISTRRACLDSQAQQIESSFLKGLEQTNGFEIREDTLRLKAGGIAILTLKAETTGADGGAQEGRVTGAVTYLQRIALRPGAVVEVKLLDVSRGDAAAVTIAEQVIRPAGRQVPIAFELRYDPRRIQERHRYVVQARILESGHLRFINTDAYPVITGGHPNTVNVIVKPVRR